MKARILLAGWLGLALSVGGWLVHGWYDASREVLLSDPLPLPVTSSPAYSDWKHLWAANNPPPNLLPQTPLLTATSPAKDAPTEDARQPQVAERIQEGPPNLPQTVSNQLELARLRPAPMPIPSSSPVPEGVESKLEQILVKLEQVEKRLDAIDKRKQAGTLEKLEKILDRVNQLEARSQEIEKDRHVEDPGNLIDWFLHLFFVNEYSPDPNRRIKELLNTSEDLRPIQEEWERIWFNDHPSHLTPVRVGGGIQ